MVQQNTLPFFGQKHIISSLNVPRKYENPVAILRAFSFLPACLNSIHYLKASWQVPLRDAGGALIIQTTRTEYHVAILWCILSGYWSWILATSMMRRWLYHYEIKHAIIRLLTLIVVTWCFNGFVSSVININVDPIKTQITICFILLAANLFKLTFASSPKYSQKIEDVLPTTQFNLKSTAIRILLLPLLAVMVLSAFALAGQVDLLQFGSLLLMDEGHFELDSTMSSATATMSGGITILVLIMSDWSSQAAERRQLLRESTLNWVTGEKDTDSSIIYRFVMGQPPSARVQSWMGPKLIEESEKYHDLLVVPAPDTLPSDKSKKLYEAFKWASSLIQFDYLVKTDDDVFVRYDRVRSELIELGTAKENYWKGFVYRNMPVNYFSPSKNMETDYPMPILPTFTSGTLYTLSRNIVDIIAQVDYPQRFVDFDDVNLSMWLFGFDLEPVHDKRIQDKPDVCEESLVAKRFTSPDIIKKEMKKMYSNVLQRQPQCAGLNKSKKCSVCYPCYGMSNDWRSSNLDCDPSRGVSPLKQSEYKRIAGPIVKDELKPSLIGVNDQWIIKDILSARTSVYTEDEANWHLLYWVCWTSDPSTFTDRHWRALEMVWIHEPKAVIIMMSNSLPQSFFQDYTRRGYNIEVVNFNKENLLKWNWYFGPGTHDWLEDWDRWEKGQFFYWHLTDYIRCLLLYNYGGTYMDMDALWIRIPPNPTLEFIGSDYSSVDSDRVWTLDDEGLYLPQGLMRFKRGWKIFREMAEGAFSAFTYDPECFNCGGPKAITSYVRGRRGVLESAGFTILPQKVLYPYSYLEIQNLLLPDPLAEQTMKTKIEPYSWNIHLFGKMTNHLTVQPDSVIDYVFKKFDLDLPHRDTKTHRIISSTRSMDVPMKLVGPRDYSYKAVSKRMIEDDKKKGNLLRLEPTAGKFQGLDVVYVRGGPDVVQKAIIQIESTIGKVRLNNDTAFTKDVSIELQDASMKQVNSVLNSIEVRPTKLMLANGGRDYVKVSLTYEHEAKIEKDQVQITMVVMEPEEEDDAFEEDEI